VGLMRAPSPMHSSTERSVLICPLLIHYVVSEIFLWLMSPKPVSRELHGPLRRFADYSSKWIAAGLLTTWWVSC
jgi:hypothetical protein